MATGTEDEGLFVPVAARHYGIAAKLAEPINLSKGVVLQYEALLEAGLECGGAYLKFLTADPSFSPSGLDGDTPYTVMFGPDKCGGTNKVHAIFRHKSPLDGSVEEKHLISPPSMPLDKKPHLYTLIINPDNTYEVKIDGETRKSGSIFSDFEPPFNPPAEIDDKEDTKPDDWIDDAKMSDSSAIKPVDWDEEAPPFVLDNDAVMPANWLLDEPIQMADPDAEPPSDWVADEDGEWEAPTIANPMCSGGAKASGCGPWTRPTKPNPTYKGKWSPPRIDNPNYKGPWAPRKIPNPKFYEDPTPLEHMGEIGAVALEIWTMSKGLLVDNVLIAPTADIAADFAEQSWKPKFDQAEAADKFEQMKAREKAVKNNAESRSVIINALYTSIASAPLNRFEPTLRPFVKSLEDNPLALYGVLATFVIMLLLLIVYTCAPNATATRKEKMMLDAAAKKKDDDKVLVDELEEEDYDDVEVEEEVKEEPKVTRRARRAA